MLDENLVEIDSKMKLSFDVFLKDLKGMRTGRASTKILDSLKVNSYGSDMPIDQLGTVSVQDSRLLTVQVWDKSQIQNVEKSIRESGLGLNPNVDGQLIRIPIPELNEERRTELTKIIRKYAEQARVAIRNIRREGMEQLKKLEKSGEISQDEHKRSSSEIQMLTDNKINLLFVIDRGEKLKIGKINFIGDKKVKERRLRDIIVSEEYKFWKVLSRNTNFNENNIDLDKRLLINYYKSLGFYNVKILSSSAIISSDSADITYNIDAGERHVITKISTNVAEQDFSPSSCLIIPNPLCLSPKCAV